MKFYIEVVWDHLLKALTPTLWGLIKHNSKVIIE